ncbi:Dynamin [Penicillium bovifimosum]|uniref:Dynamin n=1 Tax=Penicillium bovifimosum TaxID=126998 RepID=A0A9W9KWS9_9EURO|nr:Dynamin [Penicillium bovifimosum]KAJ5124015.1 Dynamin [Penicillium bovifimosum]
MLHPKFDYLWQPGQADIVTGPICSTISRQIVRIRKENIQSRITGDHVMRLPRFLGPSSFTCWHVSILPKPPVEGWAYYKVARKRFVDNVCMQGADYFLVNGPEAPMKLFSPSWVNGLSDKALEEIAGEDGNTKRRRLQLRKKITDLEAGRNIVSN